MRPSFRIVSQVIAAVLVAGAVAQQESFDSLARSSLARIEGRQQIPGLQDSVQIIRDRWGVPHIYAQNLDDLFFAQGFVQAQDRLWQMDMYRRTWSGELAEILGPSYVAHDRLARLLKFRGPLDDREWTSYHPEGKRIFEAFARGINAFIDQAGDNLPVEFKLTGLRPGRWTAETSLLRTQTAMPLADARAELALARSVAENGVAEANRRANPSPWRELVVPGGLDPASIPADASRALGALETGAPRPPLLERYAGLNGATPNENRGARENSPGSNNWAISGRLTAGGRVIVANDPHRNVANPSIRYIIHLNAPGWDVIGATEPPLPGVAIGHNGRIGWGLTIVGTDQSDVYVEEVNPGDANQVSFRGAWEPMRVVRDTIRVKGSAPAIVEHKFTRHGPVFFQDQARHRAYAIRSTMHLPGSAGYLGALRYHALENCQQFLDAQKYYLAPTENMVCGDASGNIAWHASAASPRRRNWHGRLPVPGTGEYEWDGLRDDLPREFNPERGWIATANHDIHPANYDPPLFFKNGPARVRYDRLVEVLGARTAFTMADMTALQHDALNRAALRDIPLFRGWTATSTDAEVVRQLIADWNGVQGVESAGAAAYRFVSRAMTAEARGEGMRLDARRALLERALVAGGRQLRDSLGPDPAGWRWGRLHRSELRHPLVGAYDIPAIERPGGPPTVAATGATYREIIDFSNLDSSRATNVPGQSGQPGSPFYANLTESFGRGEYFPLSFTRAAVERNAAYRLVLLPPKG
ncbi:MAG TPA: penicillin acylase family protein [Gemmatimonadaceae bacterium]